jgi:thioredoxin reductase
MESNQYEVIIIGGSYAGLAAAMALGRSLRKVLVIDAGKPCNRQTPHSHNFLTQDGKTPFEISSVAREQVEAYETISFYSDTVISASKSDPGFLIKTNDGSTFTGLKLIFATGIKDILPEIPGIQECWGISVIHCPYCHGYEVRNEKTGILANGDFSFEFGKMITNWTKDLTLYTNGKSTLTSEQSEKLTSKNVTISEKKISQIIHQDGKIQSLVFEDGSLEKINALYAKPDFEQSSPLISELGCLLKENGYVEIDQFHKTNVPGIYACGDNTNMFRSVAFAVSSGTLAGAACNKELIDESF